MPVETATVQTMTAEVRVLMVGSRQVTLSIAKQLDYVGLDEMDPFGRVNIGDGKVVIGKHLKTGALVLSQYGWHRGIHIQKLNTGRPMVCYRKLGRDVLHLDFDGRDISIDASSVDQCEILSHRSYQGEKCQYWNPRGTENEIRKHIKFHDDMNDMHKAAAELPLIVLAGLK